MWCPDRKCKYAFTKSNSSKEIERIKQERRNSPNGYLCIGCNKALTGSKLNYCNGKCKSLSQKYDKFCEKVGININEVNRIQYMYGRVCAYEYCDNILSSDIVLGAEFCSSKCNSRNFHSVEKRICKLNSCKREFIPSTGNQHFCSVDCKGENNVKNTNYTEYKHLHLDNEEWQFHCINCQERLSLGRILFCAVCQEICRGKKISGKGKTKKERVNAWNGHYCLGCDSPLRGNSVTYCRVKGKSNSCVDNWGQYVNHCNDQGNEIYKELTYTQFRIGRVCLNDNCDNIIPETERLDKVRCSDECRNQTRHQTRRFQNPNYQKEAYHEQKQKNPNWSHDRSVKRQKILLEKKIPIYVKQKGIDTITKIRYPLIRFEKDHLIPKKKEGSDTLKNIQLIGRYANVSIKNNYTDINIIQERAVYSHMMFDILGKKLDIDFNNYHRGNHSYVNWPRFYEEDMERIDKIKHLRYRDPIYKRFCSLKEKLHLPHPKYPYKFAVDQYLEQKGMCPICEYPSHIMDMVPYHIIPKSRDGSYDRSNLLLTCHSPCNVIAQKTRTPDETSAIIRDLKEYLDELQNIYPINLNLPPNDITIT